ncbi:hypothetical protein CYL18_04070 [Pradoshia eiseniae]|uniref:DUF1848 domain-containing protein n=1 Tax=Pradoshia eiseniae TaxID=2064768 RepID=A0A2S7N4U9_9BACI|nr:DUF1848 domain-containing protein [Pradoshia eiseniae]PQD97059.1 hypothetical protein CYL18_04070 [Pradoshia eiseniae]
MIISASRRTDIPAFYAEWFMNRIRAGYFMKVNPYNRKQTKQISLTPNDVDAIVFWSKNPRPVLRHLPELMEMGHTPLMHYTLNDYPEELEPGVPSLSYRINTFQRISERIGTEQMVWRYDPIILSDKTDVDYHLDVFGDVAHVLKGWTSRVTISFMDFYAKTKGRLSRIEAEKGYQFSDWLNPSNSDRLAALAKGLNDIAAANGMSVVTCSEQVNLDKYGIRHGACIDQAHIETVLNRTIGGKKDKYQRAECGCMESVDMGSYDTCPFGCPYCYAVRSDKLVRSNQQKHDPKSPYLIGE